MKRAHQHRAYRNVSDWDAPEGIVSVDIDPTTGQLATAGCPSARTEVFISGTQPVELCRMHGGGSTQVAGWETTPAAPVAKAAGGREEAPPKTAQAAGVGGFRSARPVDSNGSQPGDAPQQPQQQQPKKEERKGFFGRIRDIFK